MTPQTIPSEGWSIWHGRHKLSHLGCATFDEIIKNVILPPTGNKLINLETFLI